MVRRSSEELAKGSAMLFNGIEHGWLNFRVGATFALADAADQGAHRSRYRPVRWGATSSAAACTVGPPGTVSGVDVW